MSRRKPKLTTQPPPPVPMPTFTFRFKGAIYALNIKAPSFFKARDEATKQPGCERSELEFLGMDRED